MEESSGTKYMVAHDGSSMSKLAYKQVLENLMQGSDQIVVAHCFDPKKTYLPQHMTNDYMKAIISAELETRLTLDKYELVFEERDPEVTTHEQIKEIAKSKAVDLIVLGLHGRKKEGE